MEQILTQALPPQAPPQPKVIELGGGANPTYHPNVDARQCYDPQGNPTVDFTANFEEPLPIGDNEWDGVYCKFCLEHISWPKVPAFLQEVLRILAPGGKAIFITPNTEAQLQWVQTHPEGWDNKPFFEAASEVLFGSNDYAENSHKSYLSPTVAQQVFSAAGFINITLQPFGERATDMVIEASKPLPPPPPVAYEIPKRPDQAKYGLSMPPEETAKQEDSAIPLAQEPAKTSAAETPTPSAGSAISQLLNTTEGRAQVYSKDYFNGGHHWGGYASDGYGAYRDFPVHEVTARHILARLPESVLELGAGRGYLGKRVEDAGIPYVGLEISKHCWLTRVCAAVYQGDLCLTPWTGSTGTAPLGAMEGGMDLCFSIATMEHIPEQHLAAVIGEMKRLCRRGLHGIDFGEKDDGFDKSHCFPSGTKVAMADGSSKSIEDCSPGDRVLGSSNNKLFPALVKRTYSRLVYSLVTINLANGGCLRGTPNHPVMVIGKGWTRLDSVTPGDEVYYAVQANRQAGRVCDSQPYSQELQRDGNQVASILDLASALRCARVELEEGEARKKGLARIGEVHPYQTLSQGTEGSLTEVAEEVVALDIPPSTKLGAEEVYVVGVWREGQTTAFNQGRSSLYSWHCGRGRISLHSPEQTQRESDERRCHGVQYRPQNDELRPRAVQWNYGHPQNVNREEGIPSRLPCSVYPWIQGDSSAEYNNPLSNNKESSIPGCNEVPAIEDVQMEECSYRRGGEGYLLGVAEVVSTERHSGLVSEVFNLETETENYFANSVLVHNCTLRPRKWWLQKFAEHAPGWPVEILDKEDLERGEFPEAVLKGDGKLKLNLGSFSTMFHHGWTNVDWHDLGGYAQGNHYQFVRSDLRAGLPFGTQHVDLIMLHHVLEHFTYAEGLQLLRDCRRCLKPEGAMRIVVPNSLQLCRFYVDGEYYIAEKDLAPFDEINEEAAASPTAAGKLWALLCNGHQAAYDWDTLSYTLQEAGFMAHLGDLRRGADYPGCKQILRETTEMGFGLSLFVDALPKLG